MPYREWPGWPGMEENCSVVAKGKLIYNCAMFVTQQDEITRTISSDIYNDL